MDLSAFTNDEGTVKTVRTPRFVSSAGVEYMVFVEGDYITSASAMKNAKVCVLRLRGESLLESLTGYALEDLTIIPVANGETNAGNGFAGVAVSPAAGYLNVGYGLRHGELGLIKLAI